MATVHFSPNSAYIIKDGVQIPVRQANIALADGCECDFDCCLGYLSLPNYDTATGEILNYFAIRFEDGAPVYDTVENTRAALIALKSM